MHIYEDVTALSIVIMQLWCRSTNLHKRQFLNDDTRDEITGIHPRCLLEHMSCGIVAGTRIL